ncbi:MAG: hypothetical protein H6656_18950 [Ardenticatenaceae bacterium]|nr:hypothetical protein [Ardenticatenaceae bacterium]
MSNTYFIEKTTGTPADTLEAFGLADFLYKLTLAQGNGRLTIEDMGLAYRVNIDKPITPAWVQTVPYFALIDGLNTKTKKTTVPKPIDYLAEQQGNNLYFEGKKKKLTDDELAEQGIFPPKPAWPTWAIINQMSATAAYNGLVELWDAHKECFPELVALILTAYGSFPNDWEAASANWKTLTKKYGINSSEKVAQLQVVNPGMGKGGNRAKANGLGIGGLKGFWLIELLKFAGLYKCAIPRVVTGSKDRKTYILRPRQLLWGTHEAVFPNFQKQLYAQTAVKMDILTLLSYCITFIEQWQAGQGSQRKFARNANPGNHVAAIETIFYKHLGSAHATMNLSSLALPEWLGQQVETKVQAQQFLDLLAEHRRVVFRLDEKKGDQYNLLRQYRQFISGRDLTLFYQFVHGYSQHVMSELASKNRPPLFTLGNLEVLILAHNQSLAPILANEGFRNIAEAIRRSTVIPQGQKARGRDALYEIRYGLGDKLIRHSQYADEFVQELSRFMHAYNRENGRKLETRKQQFRRNITIEDIDQIVQLIDQFDANTVSSLLVAYGYARDPKIGQQADEANDSDNPV